MIVDRIENAHLYYGIAPHIDAALRFLQEGNLDNIAQLSIDNGNVKISCTEYTTRSCEQCKKENHRKFADIHVCLEGVDVLGYNSLREMTPITQYNPETDKQFYDGPMNYIRMLPGMFALTLTEDVHSAMMMEKRRVFRKTRKTRRFSLLLTRNSSRTAIIANRTASHTCVNGYAWPIKSISAEQISRVDLFLHIIQTAIVTVGYDGLAALFERL